MYFCVERMPLLYCAVVSRNSTILAEHELRIKKDRRSNEAIVSPPVTDLTNPNFSSFLPRILPKITDDLVEKQSFTFQRYS